MKKFLWLAILGMFVVLAPPAHALFQNGGFQTGDFTGWKQEHGFNFYGLTLIPGTLLPDHENIYLGDEETLGWITGVWTNNPLISYYEYLDDSYTPPSDRFFVTSGSGFDAIASLLPVVRYGIYSARVNSQDWDYHASRIWQEDVLKESDREGGKFIIHFAYAAVLENHGGNYRQPYFHITLKKNPGTEGETLLENIFKYAGQANVGWRTDNINDPTGEGWFWMPWTDVDLDITESVEVGDTIRIELSVSDCSGGAHGGYAYLDGFRSQASPAEGDSGSGALGALGAGCGRVIDVGGKDGSGSGPWSGVALVTFYFVIFLLPIWILKRVHRISRSAMLSAN